MISLSGSYTVVDGDRLVPDDPKQPTLQLCRSKRPGLPPHYLKLDHGRFLSSLYLDHPVPEFEVAGARYEMFRDGPYRITIEVIRAPEYVTDQTELFTPGAEGCGTWEITDTGT